LPPLGPTTTSRPELSAPRGGFVSKPCCGEAPSDLRARKLLLAKHVITPITETKHKSIVRMRTNQ